MDVVVVESPTKAKTINKYLGKDYTVIASYGHVRDLPPKDGSVRPDSDFEMLWQVDDRAEKSIGAIAKALKGAKRLILATDPDREGEAISWHVREVLNQRKALNDIEVKRVVFHEVTKDAVLDAMKHPRELNRELIEAYLARRALDYLVGFSLSPVLWRKLPGSRSAGRVQSVALRLICEREAEIEAFKAREYWSIEVDFKTKDGATVTARLTHHDGVKLDKFALPDEKSARAVADAIAAREFAVKSVEKSRTRRNPYPPFTTSTLQQEASRKLRFSAMRTMRLAQQLYEGVEIGGESVGLITYMRTDSVQMSNEAVVSSRAMVQSDYGANYLSEKPRVYKTKAKNAQEAHECVRPTDTTLRPKDVTSYLDGDQQRLYELIWKRAVASQMASAEFDQVAADIASEDGKIVLRATGSTMVFDGFLTLYQEDRDDPTEDEEGESRALPPLANGDRLARGEVKPGQHFTQPPPRYSEASLVKRMEELGIGRHSTYASILEIMRTREYVRMDKARFVPEDRGRLVTAFLTNFFERYVQYNFTAEMEEKLDEVSDGKLEWKTVLRDFWLHFHQAVTGTKDLSVSQVITSLDEQLGPHFFPARADGSDPRACPSCGEGRVGLKLGKFGAFVGCSRYPECRYTGQLAAGGLNGEGAELAAGPKVLGTDPETGRQVTVRKGPYGFYFQLDAADEKAKPKRVSIPKGSDPAAAELETALKLLSLPRQVGVHPESGKTITAAIGRFGPYILHDGTYRSVESAEDLFTIGVNRAVDMLAEAPKRGGTRLRTVGAHPEDNAPVAIMSGRYGPYLKHGKTNAPIPKDKPPEEVTMEEAVALLAARKASGGGKRFAGRGKAKARADAPPKAAANAKRKATRRAAAT
ncbi:MAG: type I DNA topoisomerase [Alphaproteobacteria bacterium]|nr:type I DNA topoisomerase [Alphaproteobacteria bacterium]